MKSLLKSLDILEFVLNNEDKPVTPAAVAEACGLNPATCTRILGELTRRDYLRKISRHDGYAPGPVIYALADRRSFYGCAAHAASEILKELAIRFDLQVNISVLHETKRYILYHYAADREYPITRKTAHPDHFYIQGTGRILLAYADHAALDRIIARMGLPGKLWPEVRSRRDLDLHLARIRKTGQTSFMAMNGEIPNRIFGTAVIVPGKPACAIGTRINANRDSSEIPTALRKAAELIRNNILMQLQSY